LCMAYILQTPQIFWPIKANDSYGESTRLTENGPTQSFRLYRFMHFPLSESGRFPSPADAKKQPLDSSECNSLIYNDVKRGLCGLRATSGWRGRREKWPGESKNRRFLATRPNIEVRRNPREPSQTRGSSRKMPNCIHSLA